MDAAVRQIVAHGDAAASAASKALLMKVMENLMRAPENPKYRRLRTTNAPPERTDGNATPSCAKTPSRKSVAAEDDGGALPAEQSRNPRRTELTSVVLSTPSALSALRTAGRRDSSHSLIAPSSSLSALTQTPQPSEAGSPSDRSACACASGSGKATGSAMPSARSSGGTKSTDAACARVPIATLLEGSHRRLVSRTTPRWQADQTA